MQQETSYRCRRGLAAFGRSLRLLSVAAATIALPSSKHEASALSWPGCSSEVISRFPGGWPKTLDWGLYWYTGDGRVSKAQANLPPSEFYQPTRKTVIFFHGYAGDDGGSTEYCYRPSPYCDPDLCKDNRNIMEGWFQQGFNVGFFYWDQFADEPCARDAEQKIWFDAKGNGLRWASYDPQSKEKSYQMYPNTVNVSVGDLCATNLADQLQNFTGPSLRFVGYDIGAQLAAHCAARLYEPNTPWANTQAKPSRITMLDPVFTERHFKIFRCGKVSFDSGVADLAAKATVKDMEQLWQKQTVPTEIYKSSLFTETDFLSDVNTNLQFLALMVTYDPDWCNDEYSKYLKFYSNWQCRHKASILQYFSSLTDPFLPLENAELAPMEKPGKCYVPSASCSDDDIKKMTRGKERTRMMRQEDMTWQQAVGMGTMPTTDDKFSLIIKQIGKSEAKGLPQPSMDNVLDDFLEPSTNDNISSASKSPALAPGQQPAPQQGGVSIPPSSSSAVAEDGSSGSASDSTTDSKGFFSQLDSMPQHRQVLVVGLGIGGFALLCYGLFPVWRKCCCCCVRKDHSIWSNMFAGDDWSDRDTDDGWDEEGGNGVNRWYSHDSHAYASGPEE